MDRKRILKTVLAVCFVLVCGALYLVFCSPFGKSDGIVFEKQPNAIQSEAEAEEGKESSGEHEKEDAASNEDCGEDRGDCEETGAMLYVHICGAVCSEGVYALPAGSRVTDGIKAAGGFREDADESFHNLAALLADGQKVYVPTRKETEALSLPERTGGADGSLTGVSGAYGSETGKKVNLNKAGFAELMTLNGIGEAKAESILKYREKVGRFQSIEELKKVSGIGDAMFERIREDIVVE